MKVIIVGAGPSGLFLAHRLLARSKHYQIEIFEKLDDPRLIKENNDKEFGFGLGLKAQNLLKSIDDLLELVVERSVSLNAGRLILIPRSQLCGILLNLLEERYISNFEGEVSKCSVNFKASVLQILLESREILVETESGQHKVSYDLLVAADGIHSTVRDAMIASNPQIYDFKQQSRPHVWKVLQLPKQQHWTQKEPSLISFQKRNFSSISAFGAYIPKLNGDLSTLIFWQPKKNDDLNNPCGINSIEQLRQLLHEVKSPKGTIPKPDIDPNKARDFLNKHPSFEYWSQCDRYHHTEGCIVAVGDAAHAMFSILAQGYTAALGDVIVLDALLEQYNDDLTLVLPEFSNKRVKEGQAASDLSLIALVIYHPFFQLIYSLAKKIGEKWLKRPSIFVRINQVDVNYTDVIRENKFWTWLGKQILKMSKINKLLRFSRNKNVEI